MDWSDIPEELLDLILSKVFTKDRHTFSLVCRSWNAAVASTYRHAPCLMINQRSKHLWKVFQHKNFFYMDFPELDVNTAVIRCSKHGWWLMSRDDETYFFFNPFNNHKIEIPAPPIDMPYSTISFFHSPTSTDCFIVGITTESLTCVQIGYLKHGEEEWQSYEKDTKRNNIFGESLALPVLHRGLVYFLDVKGNIAAFDITAELRSKIKILTRGLKQRRLGKHIREHFLVKHKGDDIIFAVFVTHDQRKVRVFRLITEPKFLYEPVEDLGDKILCVSNTSCYGYTADVKSMGNRVCFPRFYGDNLVYYSLKTRKYHSYEGGYSSENSYGLKRLDFATWTTTPLPSQLQEDQILPWCPQEDDESTAT